MFEILKVFWIYKDGLCIYSDNNLKLMTSDDEIFASMLEAVQNFIKDSFDGKLGEIDEMGLNGKYVIIIGGVFSKLCLVCKGSNITGNNMVWMLKRFIKIERNNQDILFNWDGTIEALIGATDEIKTAVNELIELNNQINSETIASAIISEALKQRLTINKVYQE
jgi:hypothetical protein